MNTAPIVKNWASGTNPAILGDVHLHAVNMAIYNRDIGMMTDEINSLLKQGIAFRSSGDIHSIWNEITQAIDPNEFSLIIQDLKDLLILFQEITHATSFRLFLATINNNMCKRFHTDINVLRLLCTYSGPGTLWLTEDNINRKALDASGNNECIVIDKSRVQQTKTGSVAILKGAIYPQDGTKAVVHRSPTIEESGEKRLLLRIDTNEFLNF